MTWTESHQGPLQSAGALGDDTTISPGGLNPSPRNPIQATAPDLSSLVVVDSTVPELDQLIAGLGDRHVLVLDSSRDGIAQITEAIASHNTSQNGSLDSLHIISHGSEGNLTLGSGALNAGSLAQYRDALTQWGNALSSEGDILLYGCDVAGSPGGASFVAQLSQLTGADVAASDDLTGAGGDWDLEVSTGGIESAIALDANAQANYQGTLATYNGKEYILTSRSKTWVEAEAEAISKGGHLVTVNDRAEENWLRNTFGKTQGFWIGINDAGQEGKFEWANGEPVTYTNWAPGEPNDAGGDQDFGWLNYSSSRQWDDNFSGAILRGIIEIDKSNPPPPSDGTKTYKGKKYKLTSSNLTWQQAESEAQAAGGHLVTVNDRAEETWLRNNFSKTEGLWIGINDANQEGKFEWANGEAVTYTNWAPGEPNDAGGFQDYGWLNYLDGQWDDNFNNGRLRGIIEIPGTTGGNEPTIILSQDRYQANENVGTARLALTRSGDLSKTSRVQYQLFDGTAKAGSDYTARNGTVTFNPGQSRANIPVAIINDSRDEPTENLNVTILAPTNATLGTRRTALLDIIDNDAPAGNAGRFQMEKAGFSIKEDGGNARLVVNRIGGSAGQVTVRFGTANGTAKAGSDFTAKNGTLTFKAGETRKTVLVPIRNDGTGEPNETFRFNLSNPTGGATLDARKQTTVTIIDEDDGTFANEVFANGLSQPTAFDWSPDQSLMFVAQKQGQVKVLKNGSLQSTNFIDLSDEVNGTRDRGLLGIAVHPDFSSGKPFVYLGYTYDPPEADRTGRTANLLDDADGKGNRPSRVVRVTAEQRNGNWVAKAGSKVVILGKNSTWANTNGTGGNSTSDLTIPPSGIRPNGSNINDYLTTDSESHTIGQLRFGKDGSLFVSNGDGTSYNTVDPRTKRVQDINNLSGKLLRIDPITGKGLSDNPFYNGNANSNRSKVYAYGFRNPFRFTINPTTGQPFVGDVGWFTWEEVNAVEKGQNYGWPLYEGGINGQSERTARYKDDPEFTPLYAGVTNLQAPLLALPHANKGGNARAIVMGDFYTGNTFPSIYNNSLFINDANNGTLQALLFNGAGNLTGVKDFNATIPGAVQISTGKDGNLYFASLGTGEIRRFRPDASARSSAGATPTPNFIDRPAEGPPTN